MVFCAWSSWTDDYDEYAAQPEILYYYCANTSMVFAFVILLLKWGKILKFKKIPQVQPFDIVDPDPTDVCNCFLLWVSWGLLLLLVLSSF